MSTGRLTWLQDRWNSGQLVDERPLPRFRIRYSDAAAQIIDRYRRERVDHLDGPRGPDIQRSLRAIEERGRKAIGGRWGFTLTESLIVRESYRLYNTEHYWRLPDEGLRSCARAARQAFSARPGCSGGPPSTDRWAVPLVRELDGLWFCELRARELQLMRQREARHCPTLPVRSGKATAAEAERLEAELFKLVRRALRVCGIRGQSDANIERLLAEPVDEQAIG